MKNILTIETNFSLNDEVRSLAPPPDYEVSRREPLSKSATEFLKWTTSEAVTIILVLEQVGLVEWMRSKAYDALWVFLKDIALSLPKKIVGRTATFEVKDSAGETRLRVEIPDLKPDSWDQVKIKVTDKVSGSSKDKTIVIALNKSG